MEGEGERSELTRKFSSVIPSAQPVPPHPLPNSLHMSAGSCYYYFLCSRTDKSSWDCFRLASVDLDRRDEKKRKKKKKKGRGQFGRERDGGVFLLPPRLCIPCVEPRT